jgi:hypothetical protein
VHSRVVGPMRAHVALRAASAMLFLNTAIGTADLQPAERVAAAQSVAKPPSWAGQSHSSASATPCGSLPAANILLST